MIRLTIHSDPSKGLKSLEIAEAPWYVVLAFNICSGWGLHWFCLPTWPKIIKDEGEWYSLGDWYGDLGCVISHSRLGWWAYDFMSRYEDKRKVVIPIDDAAQKQIELVIWNQKPTD